MTGVSSGACSTTPKSASMRLRAPCAARPTISWESGLALSPAEVEAQAALVENLHREPDRRDLAWRLGLDDQVTDPERRQTEIQNFIDALLRYGRSLAP